MNRQEAEHAQSVLLEADHTGRLADLKIVDLYHPETALVLQSFQSMAAAESFFASPELHAAMHKAGVEGAPRIEFFEEAK